MNRNNISVEIFRDKDRKEISVDSAEMGIDHLSRVARGIEIVRTTRLLRITNNTNTAAEVINTANIDWPSNLSADLNIVLTDRRLHSDGSARLGVAHPTSGIGGKKVAVVDVFSSPQPALTVLHESGHLLNAKASGEKWDGEAHCTDPDCVMYPSFEIDIVEERVRQKGINAWRERMGFRMAEYRQVIRPRAETFCDECALEIDKRSFFWLKAKSGETIPKDWL